MKSNYRRLVLSSVVVGLLSICVWGASPARAALLVDIGQSVSGTVTPESGWEPFLANSASLQTQSYANDFGLAGTVNVDITAPFYRSTPTGSYTQVTGVPGFNDLLSGAALMNADTQTLTLTLRDLKDGVYSITTYHHTNYTFALSGAGNATLDVYLTDANNIAQLVHTGVLVTEGAVSPAFTSIVTSFEVLGGAPVTLLFDAQADANGNNHANLNAFQINLVPEPGSGLLMVLGLTMMKRRRNRQ